MAETCCDYQSSLTSRVAEETLRLGSRDPRWSKGPPTQPCSRKVIENNFLLLAASLQVTMASCDYAMPGSFLKKKPKHRKLRILNMIYKDQHACFMPLGDQYLWNYGGIQHHIAGSWPLLLHASRSCGRSCSSWRSLGLDMAGSHNHLKQSCVPAFTSWIIMEHIRTSHFSASIIPRLFVHVCTIMYMSIRFYKCPVSWTVPTSPGGHGATGLILATKQRMCISHLRGLQECCCSLRGLKSMGLSCEPLLHHPSSQEL